MEQTDDGKIFKRLTKEEGRRAMKGSEKLLRQYLIAVLEEVMKDTNDELKSSIGRQIISGVGIGTAIAYLKRGKRAARKGWNGKNQYIEIADNISYKNATGQTVNAEHEAIGNKAIAFVGTSGIQLGWLASQADMLAEDWIVFEE